jgi:hypothetical protein
MLHLRESLRTIVTIPRFVRASIELHEVASEFYQTST